MDRMDRMDWMERWIRWINGALLIFFWDRGSDGAKDQAKHCQGSLEHYRFVGTEVGLAVRDQKIIGSLCYFFIFVKTLPGSLDHWIIGANWNYLHITSLY